MNYLVSHWAGSSYLDFLIQLDQPDLLINFVCLVQFVNVVPLDPLIPEVAPVTIEYNFRFSSNPMNSFT